MPAEHPEKPKKIAGTPHVPESRRIPVSLQCIIAFFFGLSACHLVALLTSCVTALEIHEQLLLQVILRGLISLLALLLAIQLHLRVPFSRACAMALLLTYPVVKGVHYVLSPLAWQATGLEGRLHELTSAAVFLAMAFLLFRSSVSAYLTLKPGEGGAARPRSSQPRLSPPSLSQDPPDPDKP